ncbi:ORF8 [Halorubrum pleomorphic virus 2]|uniref:ORF8 n=1 Tax=Halorubrum pleomorphic virus 2 TaxID=1156719 RepID=H9ABM2_9VIRU|nr:ORF8 [Halorubrum pleomorphic virus 2]AFD03992.1 ORF8 [Halorubrum pleomorphic virus 2]
MTDVDEGMLTAAKLAEQLAGRIETDRDLVHDAGTIPPEDVPMSVFLDDLDPDVADSELLNLVRRTQQSRMASEAIRSGNSMLLSNLVGITEQELEADQVSLVATLLEEIGGTRLTTVLLAGEPNTGKTNFGWLLTQLAREVHDDLVVLSNARASATDLRVATAHDLLAKLIEYKEVPKVVLIDEGSRHFDARHKSREVSAQWTPIHKAMSKLGVKAVIVIGHTGKDVAPEVKRITSLAGWKTEKDVVELYENWPADSDRPDSPLVAGEVTSLEKSDVIYDADDPAPWSWNLDPDVFDGDYSWAEMGDLLARRGPADN